MLTRVKPGWAMPESMVTPAHLLTSRRGFLTGAAAAVAVTAAGRGRMSQALAAEPSADIYPFPRNDTYKVARTLTDKEKVTTYNNFYEFGSHKRIHKAAQKLNIDDWTVEIDGLVEEDVEISFDDLIKRMPLEERVYRLRCVEAWAATVPWSGFPLKALVDFARPLGDATFVRFESFSNRWIAPGQRQGWFPWPYSEGLTIAEATNELAFVATGLYGEPLLKQNGAPIRLAIPWKYGFKSIKSITRITFTDEQPETFWNEINDELYGFWANVNPDVPFPDWSQAEEELIGFDEKVPTRIYNGYGDYVAHLYDGMDPEKIFF